MKKTILSIAIISALLVSCNETKTKDVGTDIVETAEGVHEHAMEEMAAETHSINNAWVDEIKLDNGNKWEANVETTEGVDKMLNILKTNETKTVEDYHNLASKLNEVKNFVVKECTMEGPSHDNLHVFLHPLIEKIEALGKASTTDEGSEITASIKENLEGYYNYFK
jgi:predicted small secreted protein